MKRYLLPIIVSAVSLVVIAVVSYAYFTATIDPSGETTATVRTATIGTVTFITESPTTNLTNVYPGWEGTGTTTVYFNGNSDDDVAYHCTVQLENNSYATNVYVQTLSGSDAQVPTETALTSEGVTISQGTLEAQNNIASGSHGAEHVVTYKIIFKEIGEEQNADQGRTINTYTTCVIDQQSGSALTLVSGTMTDLSGDPIANQAMVAFSSPTYFTTDAEGHYSVRLYSGAHNIYYVPGMSMEDLVEEGKDIQTNENAVTKSVTVTTGNTQTLNPVVNINAPTKTISVTCTNCTVDASSANVEVGGTASFTITADEGYTLEGATVTGGCTLSNDTLTLANVSEDTTCAVSAPIRNFVINVSCTNCVSNTNSLSVQPNENATVVIVENVGYSLYNATVTGGCTLEGHLLTYNNVTNDVTCSVTASSASYVYWNHSQGGEGTEYTFNRKPSRTKTSYTALDIATYGAFIRTTMNGSTVTNHEVCLHNNGRVLCMDKDHRSTLHGNIDKLKAEMEWLLQTDEVTCSEHGAEYSCGYNGYTCSTSYMSTADCCGGSECCYVSNNYGAYCYSS